MNHIRRDLLLFLEKHEKSEYVTAACKFLTMKQNMGFIECFRCSVKENVLTVWMENIILQPHVESFDMDNLKNEATLAYVIES